MRTRKAFDLFIRLGSLELRGNLLPFDSDRAGTAGAAAHRFLKQSQRPSIKSSWKLFVNRQRFRSLQRRA